MQEETLLLPNAHRQPMHSCLCLVNPLTALGMKPFARWLRRHQPSGTGLAGWLPVYPQNFLALKHMVCPC